MIRFGLIVSTLLAVNPAKSEFLDGNQLYAMCGKSGIDGAYSAGYIAGFIDHLDMSTDVKRYICVPKRASNIQARDVVCAYLSKRPENRDWIATVLVHNALVEAWPCPKP